MSATASLTLKSMLNDLLAKVDGPGKPTLRDLAAFTGINEDSIYAFRRARDEARTHPNNCYLLSLADSHFTKREPVARAREWLKLAHSRGDAPDVTTITDEEIERGLKLARLQQEREAALSGSKDAERMTGHWMGWYTKLRKEELVDFSIEDERKLTAAWATSSELKAFESSWVKGNRGSDRAYILTESLQALRELGDWIPILAEKTVHYAEDLNGFVNPLTVFMAPNEFAQSEVLFEIQMKLAEAVDKVEKRTKPHFRLFFHKGVLAAPVSVAAFALLRRKPEGALLFGDDVLTNKLVQTYIRQAAEFEELPVATAQARYLTTSTQRVSSSLIEHLLKANYIDGRTGQGPGKYSFLPLKSGDNDVWEEVHPNPPAT